MKYKIKLYPAPGGGWTFQVTDKKNVILIESKLPRSREICRRQAVTFIEEQKDFKSLKDIEEEVSAN